MLLDWGWEYLEFDHLRVRRADQDWFEAMTTVWERVDENAVIVGVETYQRFYLETRHMFRIHAQAFAFIERYSRRKLIIREKGLMRACLSPHWSVVG